MKKRFVESLKVTLQSVFNVDSLKTIFRVSFKGLEWLALFLKVVKDIWLFLRDLNLV
ncbi:hypothetical protein [Veillonella caviae]|uniref:hypothetical protein n=1 Tax=Veillonella caviae TaxID=248316 RepID=UPI0023F4664B|nr:hypothetical protein [Veillonella caviae]MCI6407517.1 hypothetical protein [Veillonella caviae]MDY6224873.1 hypothetical protein [Veillonella caviae]